MKSFDELKLVYFIIFVVIPASYIVSYGLQSVANFYSPFVFGILQCLTFGVISAPIVKFCFKMSDFMDDLVQ